MLTASRLARFAAEGYLVLEDVVPAAMLGALIHEYSGLLDRHYAHWAHEGQVPPGGAEDDFWTKLGHCADAGIDWFQHLDISLPHENIQTDTPMHFGPAVFDLITHGAILDIVESVIGPEITSNPIQHVRIKPPQRRLPDAEKRAHVTLTDWHQDRGVGHAVADATQMVTVWIAVTDATPHNGCLQVIPGHREVMYPHCPKDQTRIADGFIDPGDAVPVPVAAGGIVLLHPLTPHASLPNMSDGFRMSFDLRYNVTGQPTGRAQFPEFIARSRANPAMELRDWRGWRDTWLTARAHLASVPHIPQHRWQAGAPHCA